MAVKKKMGPKIGFIGQGFVGKNHADDFERRGYEIVRYSLEKQFVKNKNKIKSCEMVFIAVPTPTTPHGFDYSIVRNAISLVGKGKIAAIKSTILPGTTRMLQNEYPDRIVMHVPEFLSEATAARDAAFPDRNIIGITHMSNGHKKAAKNLLKVLPNSPYNIICAAEDAEMLKYARNTLGYVRIVYMNLLYDLANRVGATWGVIEEAMFADPLNGRYYLKPIHQSGRGAGGHCFIKDFAALRKFFGEKVRNMQSQAMLEAIEKKNIELLVRSNKDLELVEGVYGEVNLLENIDDNEFDTDKILANKKGREATVKK